MFVDYWNVRLDWQSRAEGRPLDWSALVPYMIGKTHEALQTSSIHVQVQLVEARIYAGFVAERDDEAKRALEELRERRAGVRVLTTQRQSTARPIYCVHCKCEQKTCPNCHKKLAEIPEKGVDAWIVTDLMNLAWEGALPLAILVSSDTDFLPVVDTLQGKGFRFVHAGWKGGASKLRDTCWAHIDLDDLAKPPVR